MRGLSVIAELLVIIILVLKTRRAGKVFPPQSENFRCPCTRFLRLRIECVTSCFCVECYDLWRQAERDAMNNCRSSSGSNWRHSLDEWNWRSNTRDAERNLAVDVCSTLGRFLPQPYVSSLSRLPMPPLLPLAGTRRTTACHGDVKLERVPTPTRADQLLVAPTEQHDVTVRFPRHSRSRIAETEEVALVMMPNESRASDLQDDSNVMSRRHCQHNAIDATGVIREAARTSDDWETVVSNDSRELAVGDWAVTARQVPDVVSGQLTELSGARPGEVDGNRLTQIANDTQPSAVRRPLPPTSRYRWTSTAAQRRTAELDAKYWERRRKNNEAAKRSRDIRRANERRVALRAALLERENARLRSEVDILTEDTLRLHYYLLCSRTFGCSHCHHHASE